MLDCVTRYFFLDDQTAVCDAEVPGVSVRCLLAYISEHNFEFFFGLYGQFGVGESSLKLAGLPLDVLGERRIPQGHYG